MRMTANMNLVRTILTVLAVIIGPIAIVFGCTTTVTGDVDCTNSWVGEFLSPKAAIALSGLFMVANLILKSFQGGTPGTGLVAQTVPVVEKPQVGTVTTAQVNSVKPA